MLRGEIMMMMARKEKEEKEEVIAAASSQSLPPQNRGRKIDIFSGENVVDNVQALNLTHCCNMDDFVASSDLYLCAFVMFLT